MKAWAVLDSSALLAWMFDERGKENVSVALEKGCVMSTVNWCEVVQKANEHGVSTKLIYQKLTDKQILNTALTILAFPEPLANVAAGMFPLTKPFGLSLGDRACLALAIEQKLPVLTTDNAWSKVDLDVEVQVIR